MCFNNITAENPIGADAAVVGALRSRKTILGPAIWPIVRSKEGVFLLQTEPGLMLGIGLHQPSGFVTVVEFVWAAVPVPGFAKDEDVVAATEGIGKHGSRAKVDIGVVAGGLTA